MEQLYGGDDGGRGGGDGYGGKMHDARDNLFIDIATTLVLNESLANQRYLSPSEGEDSAY